MSKKTDKLESTFSLFDAAENPCVRNFVVTQLCDLLRQSHQDKPLSVSPLSKILNCFTERLLLSPENKWELRIAAGDAVAKAIETAIDDRFTDNNNSGNEQCIRVSLSQPFSVPSLEKLDVVDFVTNSLPLLAEDSVELPQPSDHQGASSSRDAAIRSNQMELDKRLGFVLPNQVLDSNVKLSSDDLVPDFDISLKSPTVEFANKINPVRYLEHVSSVQGGSDASLESKRLKTEKIEQVDRSEVDYARGEDIKFLSSELTRLFLLFCQNTFNPNWQTRHGALLGLRAIMALAMGDNNSKNTFKVVVDDDAVQWLTTVVFCVIVADQFADYASEEVTCPTQETAAQLFVYIAAVLSRKSTGYHVVFAKIKQTLSSPIQLHWSVLFGVLSVLKYATALSSLKYTRLWTFDELHSDFYQHLDQLLHNSSTEDDVRCLACQILTNFISTAPELFSSSDLLRTKDATLFYLVENLDSPSSVRCRYLGLLEILFKNDATLSLSVALKDEQASSLDADMCLVKLLSLSTDLIPQTRIAVLRLMGTKRLLSSFNLNALLFVAHRVFSQLLVDPDPTGLAASYSSCWSELCDQIVSSLTGDTSHMCSATAELLNKLFCLAMQHTDLPFKPEMFAYENSDGTSRKPSYLGGEAVKNMVPSEKYLFVIKLRLQAISLIKQLVDKLMSLPKDSNEHQFFLTRLDEMLTFFSQLRAGYPLFTFSVFITKHDSLMDLSTSCLSERILSILQDVSFTFEETVPLLNLIKELVKQLLELFKNAKIPVEVSDNLLELASNLMAVSVTRRPANVIDTAEQLQSRLRVASDEFQNLTLIMGRRTRSTLAAAWLRLTASPEPGALPEKLNPIIQPLMSVLLLQQNNVEGENCKELVELSADSLVNVLFRCFARGRIPSPEVKIVKNLLTQSSPANLAIFSRSAAVCLEEKLFIVLPSLLSLFESPTNEADEERLFMVAEYLSATITDANFNRVLMGKVLLKTIDKLNASDSPTQVAAASRCMAALAKREPDRVMTVVLKRFVASGTDAKYSQAPVLAASCLCEYFSESPRLKPYLVPFVRPVLSASVAIPRDCNIQRDGNCREMATKCLSDLVAMLANDTAALRPPELSSDSELSATWSRSYELLKWLRDPASLPPLDISMLKGLANSVTLRHYQIEGVTWLAFLQSNGLHGILADDLGLGKTLQALCLLAFDHQQAKTARASLILCPSTLIHHWEYEITKFFSKNYLRPVVYAGTPGDRRRVAGQKFDSSFVVISSYDIFRHDASAFFLSRAWRFCILDEGHVVRNAKSKLFQSLCRLECSHRLVLTGTPVHNTVNDIWALFEFLMPGYLGTAKEFAAKYTKPITAASAPKATERDIAVCKERLELLHRTTLPFVLRRLKSDVLKELPAKVIQDVFCDMTDVQQDLYNTLLGGATERRRGGESMVVGAETEIKHVFQLIRALRLVCNHPCLLNKSNSQLRAANYSGKFAVLRRLLVDLDILSGDDESDKGGEGSSEPDAQLPTVSGGHRVLLFCQESACLRLIEDCFLTPLAGSLSWLRMDSQQSPAERFQTAVRFNSDPTIDILLLTTRVGGQGLNLTGADTVIFFDSDWNPQADLQAMDRAHRIGQQRTVLVFRLVTRSSIEERVMSLQRFKMNVADSVVNADNANILESLSASDLYDLVFGSATTTSTGSSLAGDLKKEDGSSASASSSTSSRSFKEVVSELGDLWPEEEYSAEFDFSKFLSRF